MNYLIILDFVKKVKQSDSRFNNQRISIYYSFYNSLRNPKAA